MQIFRNNQIGVAILTFAIYQAFLGWKLAVFVLVAVGFHEMCHLLVAKSRGLKTDGIWFVPLVGGLAVIRGQPKSYWDQALVALAGPIGGGALALVTYGVYLATGYPFLLAAAYWMAILNLFNLLPIAFMDGGQLMTSIVYSINRRLGLILLATSVIVGTVLILLLNWLLAIIVGFFGAKQVIKEYRNQVNDKGGKRWLCTSEYLYSPKSLTKIQMRKVIGCWVLTATILGSFCYCLSSLPETSYSYLLQPH